MGVNAFLLINSVALGHEQTQQNFGVIGHRFASGQAGFAGLGMPQNETFQSLGLQAAHVQALGRDAFFDFPCILHRWDQALQHTWAQQSQQKGKARRLKQQRVQTRGHACGGRFRTGKVTRVQQLQRPLTCRQKLGTQLHQIALFDVGLQRQIEDVVVEDQFELLVDHRGGGLDDLAIVQAQLTGDRRLNVRRAHLQMNRRHTRNRVDALWAQDAHGVSP